MLELVLQETISDTRGSFSNPQAFQFGGFRICCVMRHDTRDVRLDDLAEELDRLIPEEASTVRYTRQNDTTQIPVGTRHTGREAWCGVSHLQQFQGILG